MNFEISRVHCIYFVPTIKKTAPSYLKHCQIVEGLSQGFFKFSSANKIKCPKIFLLKKM